MRVLNTFAPVLALVLTGCDGSAITSAERDPPREPPAPPHDWRAECGGQAALIPRSDFTNPDNIVHGPLVLSGARRLTSPETIREFGGNRFAVMVSKGHTATIEVASPEGSGSLYFRDEGGILTETRVGDGSRRVTFRGCRGKRPAVGDVSRTIWMGFLVVAEPICLQLRLRVDQETDSTPAGVPLGRDC